MWSTSDWLFSHHVCTYGRIVDHCDQLPAYFSVSLCIYSGTSIIQSKGRNSFVWIIETLNNWGLKCIHISRDFKMILNYWEFWIIGVWVIEVLLYVVESLMADQFPAYFQSPYMYIWSNCWSFWSTSSLLFQSSYVYVWVNRWSPLPKHAYIILTPLNPTFI